MTVCVAYGCSNRTERKPKGVTFHSFPKDPDTRRAWIMAVRRANWMPTKASMLCSEHFVEDVIDRCSTLLVRLHKGAVPTIFKGFPKELQEKLAKNPPPKFVHSQMKFQSEKPNQVSKDTTRPKFMNPTSNQTQTKTAKSDTASNQTPTETTETDPVPKDINPPKYLNPTSKRATTKVLDMSLEIQRQIDLQELNRKLHEKWKLKNLLKKEQRVLKKINSLNKKVKEQKTQIQNMEEFIATLKNDHYRRIKEIQDYDAS